MSLQRSKVTCSHRVPTLPQSQFPDLWSAPLRRAHWMPTLGDPGAHAGDWKYGGWGSAPKFPQSMSIEFLLRRASRGDKLALEIASHALLSMSKGGMYDVVGGGFSRYSTDNEWRIKKKK